MRYTIQHRILGEVIMIIGFILEMFSFVFAGYLVAINHLGWVIMFLLGFTLALATGDIIRQLAIISFINKCKGGNNGIQTEKEIA